MEEQTCLGRRRWGGLGREHTFLFLCLWRYIIVCIWLPKQLAMGRVREREKRGRGEGEERERRGRGEMQ